MFKRLGDIAEGRVNLLTVRTTEAWLGERGNGPVLYVVINDGMEALTKSSERRQHFETASSWLREKLDIWVEQSMDRVDVADSGHPLEVVTGDVALTLVVEGKKYLVSFYRDIPPQGWLIAGGCPRTKEELLRPDIVANRECGEEVFISDTNGRVYNFSVSTAEVEENIQSWKLSPAEIVSIPARRIHFPGGYAERLLMMYGDQKMETEGRATIDSQIASVSLTLYLEVVLPIKLEELLIFDGEKLPDGTLLNRPVQLTDEKGDRVAIFSRGQNILSAGWITEGVKERSKIP